MSIDSAEIIASVISKSPLAANCRRLVQGAKAVKQLPIFRVMIVLLEGIFVLATSLVLTKSTHAETSIELSSCHFVRAYHQTFGPLSITSRKSADGSWIAHTPWNGDFGDAAFVDPRPNFPFMFENSRLIIEARKVGNRWLSGLVASADGEAKGFSKLYGYFEIQAKLPPGKGLWPAIWLASAKPANAKTASIEIDIIEHYGHFPGDFHSVVHAWSSQAGEHVRPANSHIQKVDPGSLYETFHRYGVDVEPDWIVFYLDRQAFWRVRTPPEHTFPLMILIDLALGSGWPTDETPSPSFLEIEDVSVYDLAPGSCTRSEGQ